MTCLVILWLAFATPYDGELLIERSTITAINHNVNKSSFCKPLPPDKDGFITTCEYETIHKYFLCQQNICHEIIWDKSFEELKKLVTN